MSPGAPEIQAQPGSLRWPAWFAWGTAAFGILTAAGFFWPVLRRGLEAMVLLGVVGSIALGCGRAAADRLGLGELPGGQKTVVGASLGLGILSLTIFALAVLGLLRPWVVASVLAVFWLMGFSQWREALAGNRIAEQWRRCPWAAAAVLLPLGILLWLAWVPPHQYDSLVYHLALPQAYLGAGRLITVDHLIFSHFPQNAEMLFSLALALHCDLLAQMLMWLATALCAAWLWAVCPDSVPAEVRWLACALLATHTAVMLLASTTYVEPLVMLWTTAAAISFGRWLDEENGALTRRWLVLSALFSGLALGTKYVAGATAGVLGATLLGRLACARAGQRLRRGADLGIFVATVTAVFAPWLIKNAVNVGNPVFPFFYRFFASSRAGWEGASAQGYFHVLTEYGFGGPWYQALAHLPVQLLGNSLRFGGGMDVLGDMGWELCFWSLPVAIWASRNSEALRRLLVFCGFYLGIWFSTGVVLRFLVVLAPLLCLAAAWGLRALWTRLNRAGRAVLASGVGLLTATHLLVFFFVHAVFGSAAPLLGLEDRQVFLSRRLEYYPCARWAEENLDRNDRILIVGEQRGYYVKQPHAATTVNAPNRFLAWAEQADSPGAYARRLKAEGLGYVLLVPHEARRLRPALRPLSERGSRNWAGLEPDFITPVFQGPACGVYRLQ